MISRKENTYFSLDVDVLPGAVNNIGGTKGCQAHEQNVPDEEHPHAYNQATKYSNNIPSTERNVLENEKKDIVELRKSIYNTCYNNTTYSKGHTRS